MPKKQITQKTDDRAKMKLARNLVPYQTYQEIDAVTQFRAVCTKQNGRNQPG